MRRKDRLVIRLHPTERSVIDSLAAREHLPTSTLARRLLLRKAAAAGVAKKTGGPISEKGAGQDGRYD